MLRKLIIFFSLMTFLFTLSGCQNELHAHENPIRVAWNIWEGDYTVLIAKDMGFFEKYNVPVKPIAYENYSQIVPGLVGGKLDVGLLTMDKVLIANSLIPIRVVAVYDTGGTSAIVSAPAISTPADLKNKRIGLEVGTVQELAVSEMLKRSGLDINDVRLINVSYEEFPMLIPNEVDAGFAWEPFISESVREGNKVLFQDANISALYANVIVFKAQITQQHPELVKGFLAAWFEAVNFRKQNPEKSLEIIQKHTGLSEEELMLGDVKFLDYDESLSMFANNPGSDSSSIYYIARTNLNFMVTNGALTVAPKLDVIIDPSFLRQQ